MFMYKRKDFVVLVKRLVTSGALALGFSAFFTLPAILEQKYVHVDTLVMGYYEYIAHFANISQLLFSRFWGYGASVWAENDGMPFPVGHVHWILSVVIIFALVFNFFSRKKFFSVNYSLYPIFYFLIVGWFATFMTHSKSTFLWQLIPQLKFVQFPWRFLTLVTLSFSFVSGFIVILLKPFEKLRLIIPVLLIIFVVAFNWNYFLPLGGKMGPLTDQQKFTGAAWDLQRTAGIYDYLPKSAIENPKEGQNKLTEIIDGKSAVTEENQRTNWANFKINVESNESIVRVGIFEFPNWKVFVDGKESKINIPSSEKWGRMYVNVPKGEHLVSFKLENTPLRTVSNIISLLTWLGFLALALKAKFMLQFKRG